MTCEFSERLIMQALDGALTTRERAALDAHLSLCADCRRAWVEYASLAQTADAWARVTFVNQHDDDFTDRIRTRVAERSGALDSRRRFGWAMASAFASVGACVALGMLLPPLPIAAPDAHQALALTSTARAGLDISPWLMGSVSTLSASFDAAVRPVSHGYALPSWVPAVLAVTTLFNLAFFARVRRRAAS